MQQLTERKNWRPCRTQLKREPGQEERRGVGWGECRRGRQVQSGGGGGGTGVGGRVCGLLRHMQREKWQREKKES